MEIREITRRQFDAFCYIRAPHLPFMADEVRWFEAYNRKILMTVFRDKYDDDFGFVILGRDKRRVFRLVEITSEFYSTSDEATDALFAMVKKYKEDGKEVYEQGDEKELPHEILVPQVAKEKLHKYFSYLINEERFDAARNLIREIAYTYVDVDGDYIKSFQTVGFDGRLWELYLYIYLHSTGFSIDRRFQAPDYCFSYFDQEFALEAVSVNSSPTFDEPAPQDSIEVHKLSLDYMPIKFGSPLFSKLQKKYWEKDHVKGRPFIIAIHDYHIAAGNGNPGSMTWSRSALCDYLYGYRMKATIEDGKLKKHVVETKKGIKPLLERIEQHEWKGKVIPSGFFNLPESENVSCVLFSNNATITTFNRMGKLAGLGSSNFKMIRVANLFDPDPLAAVPIMKQMDIDSPDYEESWADGIIMYHNPNAKIPVDPDMFPEISHMFFDKENEELYGIMHPYSVLSSVTFVIPSKESV